jgi:hypothetical protein
MSLKKPLRTPSSDHSAERTRLLRMVFFLAAAAFVLQVLPPALAQGQASIPRGSKIYIHPMNGFEKYLAAGLTQKKVPVVVVEDRDRADLEIIGVLETEAQEGTKGWQAVAELGLTGRRRGTMHHFNASLSVKTIQSGDVVFAYSVAKSGSNKVQQSAAEAFAKNLNKRFAKK